VKYLIISGIPRWHRDILPGIKKSGYPEKIRVKLLSRE
jgi:hypothetical protein